MKDLIIGIHSIAAAINNKSRQGHVLWATKESFAELKKMGQLEALSRVEVKLQSVHQVQESAKRLFGARDFHYQRVSSNLILEVEALPSVDVSWILQHERALKILCLDQVTDAHNGAAILRTAAFYGFDCLVTAVKGNFGVSPTFYRIASGACEHVKIIRCASLPKLVAKFQKIGIATIGLSEHASANQVQLDCSKGLCLVLGAEDVGISHALERVIERKMALKSAGSIKSLNVSVAAAVAMEKLLRDP